ncbi:hypothetical protein F4809DRAFT_593652 [Biscogniauxia mediterranea]|nr:hypothetical protein F4809DRAFT_593652 [Biscogniauxia mediterranea]
MQPKIPDKLRYRGFHAHHPTYLSPSRFLSHRAAFLSLFLFFFLFFSLSPAPFTTGIQSHRVSSRQGLGLLLPIIIIVVIKLELKNHDAFSNSSISRILCKHTVNLITIHGSGFWFLNPGLRETTAFRQSLNFWSGA